MRNVCHGGNCPYGYGHQEEHSRASRLGWRRRREGIAEYVEERVGERYQLHKHKNHYMLKDDDKKSYIEVGREEWERLRQDAKNEITRKKLQEKIREREQRKAKRDKDIAEWKAVQAQIKVDEAEERRQAKERKKQEKEQAKAGPYRQPRLFSRERQQAQANAKRQAIAARKEQREIERLRKYEQKIQDNMKLNREREIREALKGVKIRPFQKGKDESLYRQIPKSYRSKDSAARSMDEIADELSNNYPYLNIHSSSDLAMAFEQLGLDRRNRLGK